MMEQNAFSTTVVQVAVRLADGKSIASCTGCAFANINCTSIPDCGTKIFVPVGAAEVVNA